SLQQRVRHQEREGAVVVTGAPDAHVDLVSEQLPDREAVRLDDHRAADVAVLGQAGLLDDVGVPLRERVALTGERACRHGESLYRGASPRLPAPEAARTRPLRPTESPTQ